MCIEPEFASHAGNVADIVNRSAHAIEQIARTLNRLKTLFSGTKTVPKTEMLKTISLLEEQISLARKKKC